MLDSYVLEYTANLEKEGVSSSVANIHARALVAASEKQGDFIDKELAKKSDIKVLEADIKVLKANINSEFVKTNSKIQTAVYTVIISLGGLMLTLFGLMKWGK